MKKALASALTTALVVGAASTTFAAANPFSDLPAGHWAYDAVTQLAADGVIEGYGDGTYRGDRQMTRYEMAQFIARLMAKNPQGADKALLDKLAAEFSEELNNLGVRVSNLEKHADMVQWTGELRYRYWSRRAERLDGSKKKTNTNQLQLRLFPTAEVNDHWKVKARLTSTMEMSKDTTPTTQLTYVYANGNYGKFNIQLGKMPFYSVADDGLVMDDFFSGVKLDYGDKFKVTLEAGRWDMTRGVTRRMNAADAAAYRDFAGDNVASYQGIELNYNDGNKFKAGLAFRRFGSDAFKYTLGYSKNFKEDTAKIFSLGASYRFGSSVILKGGYARNTAADYDKNSHYIELDYKGANQQKKGSWGAFVAYRYISDNVSFAPTFDTTNWDSSEKGWDFGVSYAPLHNTLTKLGYFRGKALANDKKKDTLYARVSFFF